MYYPIMENHMNKKKEDDVGIGDIILDPKP